MIVEFTGLPGSGKSTAAEHLVAAAGAREIPTRTKLERERPNKVPDPLWRVLRVLRLTAWLALRPRLAAALTQTLLASRRSRADKWFAFRHVLVTLHDLHVARRTDTAGSLTVLHEGLCQRVFFAFVDGDGVGDEHRVRRFIAEAPHPDVIIALRVAPETAIDRVRARDHGPLSYRFDGLSERDLRTRLSEGQDLLFEVAARLSSQDSPPVALYELDGERLEGSLRRLERELLPILEDNLRPS